MREIKFRAWHKETKHMFDVYGLSPVAVEERRSGLSHVYGRGDVVLMQFTGLHDKRGKEIYEGDIVRFKFDGDLLVAGPVKWRQSVALWAVDIGIALNAIEPEDLWVPETYEVIGNIYEHPELMEVGQ